MRLRKRYKQTWSGEAMKKRGQIAIFVIVAVVLVAVVVWFVVRPRVTLLTNETDPTSYLRQCIEPEVKRVLPVIMKQGGSYTPTHYALYNDVKLQYLCYTSENYKPCVVQQPLLIRHVQQEIKQRVEPKAQACLQTLKQTYEQQGYAVTYSANALNVSIVPGSVLVDYTIDLTLTKGQTQTFKRVVTRVSTEAYDLLATATSIVQFESVYGDSETSLYLQFYPNLKIEKLKKEADTFYTLTNVVTKDEFNFATRSLVWPSGYGVLSS